MLCCLEYMYLFRREKTNKIILLQGIRLVSILWYCFLQWYKISHSVNDQHSIQLGFASLNRTSIFHLMQNLIPSLDLHVPFAICMLMYRHEINQFCLLNNLSLCSDTSWTTKMTQKPPCSGSRVTKATPGRRVQSRSTTTAMRSSSRELWVTARWVTSPSTRCKQLRRAAVSHFCFVEYIHLLLKVIV